MTYVITLFTSAIVSFFGHQFAEKFLTRNRTQNIRLIVGGYQIHHSFFGMLAIAIALILAGGSLMSMLFGYGLGNIWQHKKTHNQLNEKGFVFITKIINKAD